MMCEYRCCHALKTVKANMHVVVYFIRRNAKQEGTVIWSINVVMHFEIYIVTSKMSCIYTAKPENIYETN